MTGAATRFRLGTVADTDPFKIRQDGATSSMLVSFGSKAGLSVGDRVVWSKVAGKILVFGGVDGQRDDHSWSYLGGLTVRTGTHPLYNDSGGDLEIVRVRAGVVAGNEPAGADVIVQVNMDGSPLFEDGVHIPDGGVTGYAIPDASATWANGSYLTVDITQVGSTSPGRDITVTVLTI